jgi:assimilatory nitrate reductase catalytic subunit
MILSGRGPEQQTKGVDTVTALINLMLALGRVGQPGSGYGCLTGQANGQGGREHGQKADQLPGYRSITEPSDREVIARVWNIHQDDLPGPGMSAVEMMTSIGEPGGIRGLLVFGSDLAAASPDARRAVEKLERLELLVVADPLMTATAEMAHVVLPVTQWAEEDGTVTNLEGRVLHRRRAATPPPGVRNDLDILADLAEHLGVTTGFRYPSPESVFEELRHASAGARADYSGITYRRLDTHGGLFWPCPSDDHPGTPRMFTDRFAHPDGLARLKAVEYRPPAEPPDDEYPINFTTGRDREHYNSGTQTRGLERLAQARPRALLHIHPDLAGDLGLIEGSSVVVESRRGGAVFDVAITANIRPDTVFAPIHWRDGQSANRVTVAALDPVSRMPEFKVCAVRVRPAGAPPERAEGGDRAVFSTPGGRTRNHADEPRYRHAGSREAGARPGQDRSAAPGADS